MLTQHIAIVPETADLDWSELAQVSAAIQKQVTDQLGPSWGVRATVDGFARLEDVPVGYRPILLSPHVPGWEQGVQLDDHGQPYALVELSFGWSQAASQACLDMLVNPYGSRTASGPSPRSDQGTVEFLVDVTAPCAQLPYAVGDVLVSDFCTPAYFGAFGEEAERFSVGHSVSQPYQVLSGGQLYWYDPSSVSWWVRTLRDDGPVDLVLGKRCPGPVSLRDFLRQRWLAFGQDPSLVCPSPALRGASARPSAQLSSRARAQQLRAVMGRPGDAVVEPGSAARSSAASPSPAPVPAIVLFENEQGPAPFAQAEPVTQTETLRELQPTVVASAFAETDEPTGTEATDTAHLSREPNEADGASSIAPGSSMPASSLPRSPIAGRLLTLGGAAALVLTLILVGMRPQTTAQMDAKPHSARAPATVSNEPHRAAGGENSAEPLPAAPETAPTAPEAQEPLSRKDPALAGAKSRETRPKPAALAHPVAQARARPTEQASDKAAGTEQTQELKQPPSVEDLIETRR